MHKKYLIYLILLANLLISNTCKKTDTSHIDPFIFENYLHSAKELYLVHDSISPYDTFIPISTNDPFLDYNKILENLRIIEAVYNLNSPQTDSIFNILGIKTSYCMELDEFDLYVYFDENIKLEKNPWWKFINGSLKTGTPKLDYLLEKYNVISVHKRSTYDEEYGGLITIHTKEDLNMFVVVDDFESFDQVYDGNASYGCLYIGGIHENIYLKKNGNHSIISFERFDGHENPKWDFKVENGKAELL